MYSPDMNQHKYLYLTTTGHKTGKAHEIEIWYVAHGTCFYLVSEKRDTAHWVRNIRANPALGFRLGEHTCRGQGSFPADESLISAVKAKMDEKYGWSNGLVVELCADGS